MSHRAMREHWPASVAALAAIGITPVNLALILWKDELEIALLLSALALVLSLYSVLAGRRALGAFAVLASLAPVVLLVLIALSLREG